MSSDPPSDAPGRGDVDQRTWNKGVIVATILAAFAIGVIVWLATNTPHTCKQCSTTSDRTRQQSPARGEIGTGRGRKEGSRDDLRREQSPPITA